MPTCKCVPSTASWALVVLFLFFFPMAALGFVLRLLIVSGWRVSSTIVIGSAEEGDSKENSGDDGGNRKRE